MSFRLVTTAVAGLLACASLVHAQAPQTFTIKQVVQLGKGGDRERAAFSRVPGLAELVKGEFGVGGADLNGDGKPEIMLFSLACDAAGCPLIVFESKGEGKVSPLLAQKLTGLPAITNETVNGYNAIAATGQSGAILKDARTGKQAVYPIGAGAPAAADAAPPATATPAAPPRSATAPTAPAAASVSSPKHDFLPLCMFAKCLNPRVQSKMGVGTANARAEARVTKEDATKWCAENNPTYKGCVDDRLESGGAADGFNALDFHATANCDKGEMTAVDQLKYTYAGTWPSGGPGAGRPRFKGPHTTDGTTQFEQQGAAQIQSGAYTIAEVANQPNSGESLAIQWEILCGTKAPAH
jgi:hypothetical protein